MTRSTIVINHRTIALNTDTSPIYVYIYIYLTHSGKISHIGICNKVETQRSSKIERQRYFSLSLHPPPPPSNRRAQTLLYASVFIFFFPRNPPPFSAFFRADDRRVQRRMQNGLRYIEQIQGGMVGSYPPSLFYRLSLIARA